MLLWLLGVAFYCMGVTTLLLRLPGNAGTFPSLAAGIRMGALFVAILRHRP